MLALSIAALAVSAAGAVGLVAHVGRGLFHATFKARHGAWV